MKYLFGIPGLLIFFVSALWLSMLFLEYAPVRNNWEALSLASLYPAAWLMLGTVMLGFAAVLEKLERLRPVPTPAAAAVLEKLERLGRPVPTPAAAAVAQAASAPHPADYFERREPSVW
jgi:hypothetical protein